MTWRTHLVAGGCSLWLLEAVPGTLTSSNIGLLMVFAAFGALLPDLDAGGSKLQSLQIAGVQPFAVPSLLFHRYFGHRGLLHSLLGLGIVAGLAVPAALWWGGLLSTALVLGYASHLAADACTRSGIPLFYPRKRRLHLLPRSLRIRTGSMAEDMLFPVLAGIVVLLLLTHLPVPLVPVAWWERSKYV